MLKASFLSQKSQRNSSKRQRVQQAPRWSSRGAWGGPFWRHPHYSGGAEGPRCVGGQRNQRLPWCSGLSHQLLKCPRATSISLDCDSGGGSWLQGHGGTSRAPPRSLSPCPCPREQTPPGPAAPRAGRSAAGAAGEAAAAALEPPDRSLSRLHLNVSETLFVPLTYNRQQPINRGQGSFLPAGCSGGQRPVGCHGTAARGARAGTRSWAQHGGIPGPAVPPAAAPLPRLSPQ